MAISKQIKGITIEINGDTTNLGKALGAVEGKSKSAESELRKVNRALKDVDPNSTVLLQQKQDILNEAIEATSEKLRAVEDAQEQVKRKFASGEIDAGTYREFQRMVETTRKKLSDLETEAENVRDAQRSMGNNGADFAKGKLNDLSGEAKTTKQKIKDIGDEFNDAEDDARGFGGGLDAIHVAIGNLAASGVQSLGGAIKDFISDNQSAANNLAAKAGLTDEEMQQYSPVMEDIYRDNYGESLNDVADAMAVIKQTSGETDPSRLKEMVENAMTLRDVFGFEISEQMRAVNMLVDQFGVTADKAFNLITDGAQKGLNKNDDLLDTINEYSVHYKQQGYSAEEFFNSLLNGAESGTFSVDKLGDAVKEFGIRLKDTSTTTSDALAALGYSAGEDLKEIQDTKDTIADLEKKLKYAKMEQANFNEETSELTRLKNADKIEEYNESLKNAKSKLAALTSEAKNSGASVQDLQDRFAAGGSSARKAAKEVLDKLFAMDDQVAQNSIGVGLFGTMWEDLGADGVKALMNVSGEIGKTEDALQKVKDVKYNDISNELSGLGREFQSEILNPVIKDFLPDIKNGIKWLKDNLNNIKPMLITTGTIIGTTFAVSKIAGFIGNVKNLIGTFTGVAGAIKTATTAQSTLNAVQLASPVGIITAAVAGLAGVIYLWNENEESLKSNTDDFIQNEQKRIDKINEEYKNWTDTKEARDKVINDTSAEFGYYRDLKTELDNIVTPSGEIKKGYEDRAKFITEELEHVTGLEIQYNNGVIQNYKDLSAEIDNALKKKKAEATLSAYDDSYNEAIKNRTDYFAQMSDLERKIESTKAKIFEADQIENSPDKPGTQDDFASLFAAIDKEQLKNDLADLQKAYDEVEEMYLGSLSTIQNYENLSEAIVGNKFEKFDALEARLINGFQTAENGTRESLQKQLDDYNQHVENLKQAMKDGAPGVTEEMIAQAEHLRTSAKNELAKIEEEEKRIGKKAIKSISKVFGDEIVIQIEKIKSDTLTGFGTPDDKAKAVIEQYSKQLGESFSNGLIQGCRQYNPNDLTIFRDIMEQGKKEWDIHSPSRVSRNLAKMFIRGLSFGVTDEKTSAIASFGAVGLQAVKTLKEQLNTLPVFDLNTRYTAAMQSGDISPSMAGSKAININIDKFVNNTDRDIDALAHQISCAIERETAIKSRGMGW